MALLLRTGVQREPMPKFTEYLSESDVPRFVEFMEWEGDNATLVRSVV